MAAGASPGTSSTNLPNKVTVLVWSEFSRRIYQNDNGTDHGSQGPMLVIGGAAINGGVYGNHPNIDRRRDQRLDDNGNTATRRTTRTAQRSTDFRDVYGTIMKHWLGIAESVAATAARQRPRLQRSRLLDGRQLQHGLPALREGRALAQFALPRGLTSVGARASLPARRAEHARSAVTSRDDRWRTLHQVDSADVGHARFRRGTSATSRIALRRASRAERGRDAPRSDRTVGVRPIALGLGIRRKQ